MLHAFGLVVLVVPLPEVPAELLLRDQAFAAMVLMLVLYLICRSVQARFLLTAMCAPGP